MKRKKELIVVLTSLLVIVLSVSVAYFTTKILGTGKEISVESADLKVIFTSGSGTINGTNIEPGWTSGENTFTVKNESNGTYKYNIIIKDLVNTFVTEGFLQYKIISTDGGYNMTDFEDVPKSKTSKDVVIAYNINIDKKVTHTYIVEFKYLESTDVDQSEDMGKTLTGKIFITKGTERPTLANQLLNDNPTISTRTDFSTAFTTNTPNTLYKTTENGTDVYYFAGQDTTSVPINNWVKFGKYQSSNVKYRGYSESTPYYIDYSTMEECTSATSYNKNCTEVKYYSAGGDIYWRIIRTNADGSLRLLYSGTSPDTTENYIGRSVFNTADTPKCVGYMYGDDDSSLDGIRANTKDSLIKEVVDSWYSSNLSAYTNYLSSDAVYCNDRELASGNSYSTSSVLDFKSSERLNTNKTPTYDCTNTKDAFSVNNTEAKLKYPIALMTADEISYAGGVYFKYADVSVDDASKIWIDTNSNFNYYNDINKGEFWWVNTPYYHDPNDGTMVYLTSNGILTTFYMNTLPFSVRPVTSLKSCVTWKSGDGSASNPYEIVETSSGC